MGKKFSKFLFEPQLWETIVLNTFFASVLSFIYTLIAIALIDNGITTLGYLLGSLLNTFLAILALQGLFYILVGIFYAIKKRKKHTSNFMLRGFSLLIIAVILGFIISLVGRMFELRLV